jgi:hypothetical protein
MLARDARVLQRALEDAGLQTDSNSLSFRHDDGGDRSARGFDGFGGRGYAGSNDPAGAEIAETGETITRRAIHDGVLDVEI